MAKDKSEIKYGFTRYGHASTVSGKRSKHFNKHIKNKLVKDAKRLNDKYATND